MNGSSRRRKTGKVFAILGLLAVALLMVWLRAYLGSRAAYGRGEASLRAEEFARAITFFDRSMHWYAPFNPYVAKSAQRLWEIGEGAKQRGDIRLALLSLRSIRRSYYAARSLYTPGEVWIRRAEGEIARLTAWGRGPGERAGPSAVKTENDGSTDLLWTVLLEIGLLGWIGSVVCLTVFVFQKRPTEKSGGLPALWWGVPAVILFCLWLVGMMKA